MGMEMSWKMIIQDGKVYGDLVIDGKHEGSSALHSE